MSVTETWKAASGPETITRPFKSFQNTLGGPETITRPFKSFQNTTGYCRNPATVITLWFRVALTVPCSTWHFLTAPVSSTSKNTTQNFSLRIRTKEKEKQNKIKTGDRICSGAPHPRILLGKKCAEIRHSSNEFHRDKGQCLPTWDLGFRPWHRATARGAAGPGTVVPLSQTSSGSTLCHLVAWPYSAPPNDLSSPTSSSACQLRADNQRNLQNQTFKASGPPLVFISE